MKPSTFSRACFLFILSVSFILPVTAQVEVNHLLCEKETDPVGIGTMHPRFNWQLQSNERNVVQTAYEIQVTAGHEHTWGSGKVMSHQSVDVDFKGVLQSVKKYSWQVRVWDSHGHVSHWSAPATFITGLLNKDEWKAKWIEPGFAEDTVNRPANYFRKQFPLSKKIASATLSITAHGLYEAHLNGQRVGTYYLTPGWTSYTKRLQYQVYDVTALLKNGSNALAVVTGDGWYRGPMTWDYRKNIYGGRPGVLCQVNITYQDGSTQLVVSDETWKSATGSIVSSEIYNGETIDARLEKKGWTMAGYDDNGWKNVNVQQYSNDNLISTWNEPVKKHETFHALRIFTTPAGEHVIDFGQNLVGWVIVKAKGKPGDRIVIRHAEVLDRNGNFYTANYRAAQATSKYYLSGNGEETFEPHFTFYGFRYIKIEDYPGTIDPANFTAVALYSDMSPTGTFSSSDALINQLQHNIQWGQRGNFLDIPTDCPQRDERLGWTGDAQVFSRTAAFNFGVNNFFAKWLQDVQADQKPNGMVPHVIPNVLGPTAGGATGWADVATIIPWNMYLVYGDKQLLANQYESMKAWVGYMEKASNNYLWNTGNHFGDWLFYRPFDDNDGKSAVTDKYLIAQCFFANSVQIMINAAGALGKTEDVTRYTELLKNIKEAFVKEYVTPNGRLVSGTQTAYVLALNFDMLPENLRPQAVDKLVTNIKSYNNHLTTGFLGTPYLCHVLSRFGKTDVAYTLLQQQTYPSWLYPVKMGATTIWERWSGMHPDSTFEPASMNSFNHYAYGAIGDWMYRVIAGIDTYEDDPGYKHIKIQPHIGGTLTQATAELQTYYGQLSSSWQLAGDKLSMDIIIPANTAATIYIPAAGESHVSEGDKALSQIADIKVQGSENGYVVVQTGSGHYHFEVKQ